MTTVRVSTAIDVAYCLPVAVAGALPVSFRMPDGQLSKRISNVGGNCGAQASKKGAPLLVAIEH